MEVRAQKLLESADEVIFEDRSDDEEGDMAGQPRALLVNRPGAGRAQGASDKSPSSAAAFDVDSLDIAGALGLDDGEDDSALSKEERVRLARLLASPKAADSGFV